MAGNFVVSGRIWLKFKLIQAYMRGLVSCKNEDVSIKMKALQWSQHFSHCKSMGIFFRQQWQLIITPQSRVGSDRISNSSVTLGLFSLYLQTLWNSIKPESARVFTLYIDFSAAQGQITPESVVGSDRNSNSSKLSCFNQT